MTILAHDFLSPEARFYEAVEGVRSLKAKSEPKPLLDPKEAAGEIKKPVRLTAEIDLCGADLNDLAGATRDDERESTVNCLLRAFDLDHQGSEKPEADLTERKGFWAGGEYASRAVQQPSMLEAAVTQVRESPPSFRIAIFIITAAEVMTAAVLVITLMTWLSKDAPTSAASTKVFSRSSFSAAMHLDDGADLKLITIRDNGAIVNAKNPGVTASQGITDGSHPPNAIRVSSSHPHVSHDPPEKAANSPSGTDATPEPGRVLQRERTNAFARELLFQRARLQVGLSDATITPPYPGAAMMKFREKRLLAWASWLLKNSDIDRARLFLEKAVNDGSAQAAYMLAQTYDPRVLQQRWPVLSSKGNPAKAQSLYAKAQIGDEQRADNAALAQ